MTVDPSTLGQVLLGAAAMVTAVVGARKIWRDSRHASETQALEGFDRLVKRLEERLGAVERDLAAVRQQSREDQRELTALRDYVTYLLQFIREHVPGRNPRPMQQQRRKP